MNRSWLAGLSLITVLSVQAYGATGGFGIAPQNTIPGVVATGIVVDGEGVDWTGAVLKIDLNNGSVYNDPSFDSDSQQQSLWAFVPALKWDSYVGIPGDGSGGIAGGAGDFGGGPQNIGWTGTDAVSVSWFNTNTTDIGPAVIGLISLTEDAAGTWQFLAVFADDSRVSTSGVIESGAMGLVEGFELPPPYPEPGTLALLGLSGLALLRRRRG